MGICGSSEPQVDATTKAVDAQLREDKKRLEAEVKLLLLGAGDSGKSTVVKQMKIIHNSGFTPDEIAMMRPLVVSNVIECSRVLVLGAESQGQQLAAENQALAAKLSSPNAMSLDLEPALGADIARLWQDPAIAAVYEQRSRLQLPDSCKHVLDNVARIAAPDFVPNTEDILRCRARTTGIHEILFKVENYIFRMVDVGGQRSERKKWVHCFQDVTAIVFIVAMDCYDLKLYEDENVNRMHESIQLFDEICNSKWFKDTALVLFLNKTDLFKDKIEKTDLKVCFADYMGGCNFANASAYLQSKFKSLNRQPGKNVYMHLTCATNTENVRVVFQSVRDVVLKKVFNEVGF